MLTNKLMGKSGEDKQFIEDLFAVHLYTGNGSTQTITNGIDLAGKGGMVWIKNRGGVQWHSLYDTSRGRSSLLYTNSGSQADTVGSVSGLTTFNSNGFSLGTNYYGENVSAANQVSWTFRKAPNFFDVVTYTGNGSDPRDISHNLGSVPGVIIVKRTDSTDNWIVYHRSVTNGYLILNSTSATSTRTDYIYQNPTSTTFRVGGFSPVNASGATYVAYLFAHDTSTDGLIQCGSYTGNGSTSGPIVNLGWEPQWVMIKNASGTGNWQIIDNMRGMPVGSVDATLQANLSDAESSVDYVSPTATGFQVTSTSTEVNTSGSTYIYMAIRRGPMRTPTDGTKVFLPTTSAGGSPFTTGFNVDSSFARSRTTEGATLYWGDRLRGKRMTLATSATAAEADIIGADVWIWDKSDSFQQGLAGTSPITCAFRRAPGFFDVVCYTGDGYSSQTIYHNLKVKPQLVIVKRRGATGNWCVSYAPNGSLYNALYLNSTATNGMNDGYADTFTQYIFNVYQYSGYPYDVNSVGFPYVAYLFASCPGVSKVGSYTGTGTTKQIDCGFTAGARFVLIKRTDSTGGWYTWDSARGIVSGNDPYLLMNSTAAEVTTTDYIDPYAAGFEISSTAPAEINASGGTFIYLAIA